MKQQLLRAGYGLSLMVLLFGASSCRDDRFVPPSDSKMAYRPVYSKPEEMRKIYMDGPQPLMQPGKIYYKDNVIFINEGQKGVHVVDNSDPKNPKRVAFIHIPGNSDIAIKGNVLYADNFTDLVALDISQPDTVSVLNRIPNLYPVSQKQLPEETGVWFECPDSTKGVIVGWEKVTKTDKAKCFQ